jgi:peptidoglycan/xylan/chitin deacetylase (PgdA/CDA1 family)
VGFLRFGVISTAALALLGTLGFGAYEYGESPASQLFGATLVSGPADRHVVALTFDDGPNPPYTNGILAVLERERVHATFFVVGRAVAAYPAVVRREVRDGDAIGNHTWDHGHLLVLDASQIQRSLELTNDAIVRAAGTHTTLMRPPFGARDWFVLAQARRLGYTPVMWSVPLAGDWENPPPGVIAARILRYVRNGSIIVLHDGNQGILCDRAEPHLCDRSGSVAATRMIVEALKGRGYRFVTIPELIRLHA